MGDKQREQYEKGVSSDSIRKLESQRLKFRTLQSAIDTGNFGVIYEWFEDNIIKDNATLDMENKNGIESATIRQVDPVSKREVSFYYTADPNEIGRLRGIKDHKVLIIDKNPVKIES